MRKIIKGKRVTVLGAARSGRAVANLLIFQGAEVFLSDDTMVDSETRRWCKRRGIHLEEGGHSELTLNADFMVVSPGVPTSTTAVQEALAAGIPVYSELEVASWYANGQIIAITGTNGKTTTASLVGHMMRLAGRHTVIAGNIGTPLSESIEQLRSDTMIVLEVSSFQLDHTDQFRPDVSVILNITPDHLDRYEGNFDRYASSKLRIYKNQIKDDVVIYNYDDTLVRERVEYFASQSRVCGLPFSRKVALSNGADALHDVIQLRGRELMPVDEIGICGPHNVSNSLASVLVGHAVSLSDSVLHESLRGFQGVDHRLEVVRRVKGVTYVNDSKATNVSALRSALLSFKSPIILLVGGQDKGNDYNVVKSLVCSKVHTVIAFGESAPKVVKELGPYSHNTLAFPTLEEATHQAHRCATDGDTVLLSPGCASFDLFSDYQARGAHFRQIVEEF